MEQRRGDPLEMAETKKRVVRSWETHHLCISDVYYGYIQRSKRLTDGTSDRKHVLDLLTIARTHLVNHRSDMYLGC